MSTYILTWNPKKWHWSEELYEEEMLRTARGELVAGRWSCGRTKRILPGDRLFLLRQRSLRGIISSGFATSEVIEDEQWDVTRQDRMARYVEYQSDALLPAEQRLPVEQVLKAALGIPWNNLQASGVRVPEQYANRLEKLWERHLAKLGRSKKPVVFPEESSERAYIEGATQRVIVNAYERNPEARAECLAHYGLSCVVCDFSFAEAYGELGEGYIHVHHLRELARIRRSYRIVPVRDLRPVCPNCHAMLHQTTPALTVEELRRIIKQHLRQKL